MSEFKGTKGEWYISGTREVVSMPAQVKIGKIDGSNYEECKHNAKLIAAAPELLEACIDVCNVGNMDELHESRKACILAIQKALK